MQTVDVLRPLTLWKLFFGPRERGVDLAAESSLGSHGGGFAAFPDDPARLSSRLVPAPTEALRQVPLFSDLDERELERLADRFQERPFPEGATLVEEGSTGSSFFVIGEGNVNVSVGGETRATLGPGDHFGEMAIVDDGVRSASVTAATDVRTYFLTPWEFRPFVEEHPEVAWKLLQTLARRLRSAQAG
jgi:CRP/FNR family transcriptional regulator, cyclic AMP receptor protein